MMASQGLFGAQETRPRVAAPAAGYEQTPIRARTRVGVQARFSAPYERADTLLHRPIQQNFQMSVLHSRNIIGGTHALDAWVGGDCGPFRKVPTPPPPRSAPSAEAQQTERVSSIAIIRDLLRQERISAAREVLAVLSADLLEDPALQALRRALAPPLVRASSRLGVDRSREFAWLREHAHEYRGQWVAINESGLVIAAPTLRELRDRLREYPLERPPLLHRL